MKKTFIATFRYRTATNILHEVFEKIDATSLKKARDAARAMVGKDDQHKWLTSVDPLKNTLVVIKGLTPT